jgi:nitrite reductase (NADH) large subunit
MKQRLVVVGNGMAGMRTVEELLKLAPDLYDITVFGAEPHGNYNRIMLSSVLAGEKALDEIMLNDEQWYIDNNITLRKGEEIVRINRKKKLVETAEGGTVGYDRLLLATGADPIVLPVPGRDLPGVVSFREIHDVEEMLDAAGQHQNAVVIGGGLLGLEAAHGLMKQGMKVTIVHLMDNLMERQLDAVSGAMLRRSLEERGLNFLLSAETEAILVKKGKSKRVSGVKLKDGTKIDADIVVMAIGIRPCIALAQNVGIYCERGIVVGDTMQTYDPVVYAVGECIQHRGQTYGLVAPLFEQAKVCANQLAAYGHAAYKGSTLSTRLKVTGIDLFSAGNFADAEDTETLLFQDAGRKVYKKLVLKDNRIQGAVFMGDTADAPRFLQLMRDKVDVSDDRERLLFGHSAPGEAGRSVENAVLALSDETEVCGCNGVCKGDIVHAITEKKLFTLDDVRAHTKASSSCGSCTTMVQQILSYTLGGDFSETPAKKPLCKCTEFSHDDIRKSIDDNELKTIPELMAFMAWLTPDGCATCRQALNYYLLCAWPGEYEDDGQSRFINERVHANIQKDGTYSVVPRMWGGLTNADELRSIADVAEKFSIPTIHVTGGQRIDLLGIDKEDLPGVWHDLNKAGMVSGHAYAKGVRTVKTCVGSEWCRFGTQASMAMGVKLEQACWGSWTPHKFKMAVSGCPRNCAEATIKDFGVVAVESGWELHIGGNGGVKVRATDLLCKVENEEEVLEYCNAFLQLYREEAHYLDRTARWLERTGLSYVKQRIVEDEAGRKALAGRFLHSQRFAQQDPWKERAENTERPAAAHEFTPLKMVVGR